MSKPHWPLEDIIKFKFYYPSLTNFEDLNDYFGGKITIYFIFMAFYATSIMIQSLIGLSIFILVVCIYNTVNQHNQNIFMILITVLEYVLGFISMIWSGMFFLLWNRKERDFQLNLGSQRELDPKVRIGFNSFNYKRSLFDDFINNKSQFTKKTRAKIFAAMLITLLCYGVSFGLMIGVFYLKNYILDLWEGSDTKVFSGKQNVINLIEIFKIIIFDLIFKRIARKLSLWIDFKYNRDFENFYIIFVSFFSFLNNFFPIFFIFLFKDRWMGCSNTSTNTDSIEISSCLLEGENFFEIYIIVILFIQIIRMIYTFYRIRWQIYQQNKKKEEIQKKKVVVKAPENNHFFKLYNKFNEQKDPSNTIDENQNEYQNLNTYIEEQIHLQISNDDDETDPTLDQFFEVFIWFSALACFSLLFPLCWLIAFFIIISEIYLDKLVYFNLMRRPSPIGETKFGTWIIIMKIVTLLGVLTNAYILAFHYSQWFIE